MKITRRELKRLIEAFIGGPLGTMDARDPYEDLHAEIKNKLSEKGSLENPPISGRDYFLKFKDDHETLGQISSFNDSLYSKEQTYDYDTDQALEPATGEEMSKQIDFFDDPMGEYYKIDNVIKYYKSKMPDLHVKSTNISRMFGIDSGYRFHHEFYSDNKEGLLELLRFLESIGYKTTRHISQLRALSSDVSLIDKYSFGAAEPKGLRD